MASRIQSSGDVTASFGSVARRAFDLVVGQGGAQLITAFTFLFLARQLQPSSFGNLAALYGVAMFLSILLEFGATNSSVRELARDATSEIFRRSYYARVVQTSVLVVILLLASLIFDEARFVFLVLLLGSVSALARVSMAPMRARQSTRTVGALLVSEKLLVAVLVLIATMAGIMTGNLFILISAISAMLTATLAHACWARFSLSFRRGLLRNPFGGSTHMGVTSVAVGLQTLDAAVLAATAGPQVAGIFAAVGRWTQPMSLVAQAVTQSALAGMALAKTTSEALRTLKQNLAIIALSAVPLALVALFAEPLVIALLGPNYSDSIPVLRLLVAAVIFGSLNSPMSAFLQTRYDERFTSLVLSIGIPCQIALMGLLAASSGATASAGAVVTVQIVICVIFSLRVRLLLQQSE